MRCCRPITVLLAALLFAAMPARAADTAPDAAPPSAELALARLLDQAAADYAKPRCGQYGCWCDTLSECQKITDGKCVKLDTGQYCCACNEGLDPGPCRK